MLDLEPGDRVVVDQGGTASAPAGPDLRVLRAPATRISARSTREHGITGLPGALAEFITVPAVNTIKIDPALAARDAALTEPLGCIVHSCDHVARFEARYRLRDANPCTTACARS